MFKYKLSIILVSYNQEKYILEAINSIKMQNVNFEYEVIFADDFSTDKTRKIILENSKDIKNKKYLFSKKNYGNTKNILNAYKNCDGQYIIALEGDDYWLVSTKIKKQYDFLEKNSDYIAVSDRRITINSSKNKIRSYPEWLKHDTDVSLNDLLNDKFFSGIETMFRNVFNPLKISDEFLKLYLEDKMIGDLPLCFYLCSSGKVYSFADDMAVYRTSTFGNNENYNSNMNLYRVAYDHIKILNRLYDYYKYDFSFLYSNFLMEAKIDSILNHNRINYNSCVELIPKEFIKPAKKKIYKTIPKYIKIALFKIIFG